ncbi:MAG: hypothetical protein ACC658_08665, partial [Acidimicrobiia bacterium]
MESPVCQEACVTSGVRSGLQNWGGLKGIVHTKYELRAHVWLQAPSLLMHRNPRWLALVSI